MSILEGQGYAAQRTREKHFIEICNILEIKCAKFDTTCVSNLFPSNNDDDENNNNDID